MTRFDEIKDFNPKSWLSRYRRTSIPYLIKMGIFYSVIGILLQQAGDYTAQHLIANYTGPHVPYSVVIGLTSGPVEETVFFGLPFYLSGSYHIVLLTGIIWSVLHIFSTESLKITTLAYGNLLFTIPHIFFSLRTWSSGKGWFAILFHSSWNVTFLVSYCLFEQNNCVLIGNGQYFLLDILGIISAGLLLFVTYRVYKYKRFRGTEKIGK
jgi:hypothetical protein